MRPQKTISSCPRCCHKTTPHCISANSCDRPGRHTRSALPSCPFVQFVGNNISLRTICLEGSTERSDGNRVRSARICVASTMCLEGTTPQDLPLNKTSLHSCQFVRPNRSPFMFIDTKIRVNSCNSWAYKNLSWATKNSRPLYAFFIPEKPVNPALVPLIP